MSSWSKRVSVHSSHRGWSTSVWPDMMSKRSPVTWKERSQGKACLMSPAWRSPYQPAHCKTLARGRLAFSLRLRFSMVPPSDASPIRVKLLALSVDIILQIAPRPRATWGSREASSTYMQCWWQRLSTPAEGPQGTYPLLAWLTSQGYLSPKGRPCWSSTGALRTKAGLDRLRRERGHQKWLCLCL